ADEIDEFLRLCPHRGFAPARPFRRNRKGDVAHHAPPGQQRVALEDHGEGAMAWLWNMTARSRLGPSIAWLSTITAPSEGASSPARMLSTVVLPQPEWPIMQVKSPRCIGSKR